MTILGMTLADFGLLSGLVISGSGFVYKVLSYLIKAETRNLATRDDLTNLSETFTRQLDSQSEVLLAKLDQRLSEHQVVSQDDQGYRNGKNTH